MIMEILYYFSLIGTAVLILSLIVFAVYCCRKSIMEKTVFYKGFDLRPRVFFNLRYKWRSCDEGDVICTDCPHFDDCVMSVIGDVKNEIDEELKNDNQ